jgi:signal transduction histidine kinase
MCQQIIESANGKIYFKTVPGSGTSFYMELPLMKINPIISSESESNKENSD